jgi:hypothetical protein
MLSLDSKDIQHCGEMNYRLIGGEKENKISRVGIEW